MTGTPAPDAAVQIAYELLRKFGIEFPRRDRAAYAVCVALAREYEFCPPGTLALLASRTADHDAVVAERDAAVEELARLRELTAKCRTLPGWCPVHADSVARNTGAEDMERLRLASVALLNVVEAERDEPSCSDQELAARIHLHEAIGAFVRAGPL